MRAVMINCESTWPGLSVTIMGGSRKKFRGGEPNKVNIKVAQINVLLALQLRTSLVISQLPV